MLNEKEIKLAASEYKIPRDRATFEQGVQWALEQMKQKPLYVFTIYTHEGIEKSYRNEEDAKARIESLKKDHPSVIFWYEKELIK